jgi:tRNA pseudouridine13 synthase
MSIDPPGAAGYTTTVPGTAVKVTSFEVFEVPKFFPTGTGQHFWGLLEKTGRNTLDVVKEIARWNGSSPRDMGYSGLKDRNARTLQWLSSPGELPPVGRGFKFWVVRRSTKKLKTGNLLGNWFRLRVEPAPSRELLNQLRHNGIPNFFGPQRFSTSNHEIGELLVRGEKRKARAMMNSCGIPLTFKYYRLMEDAYCSYLFNKVLTGRLPSPAPLEGDIISRHGPTGPIFGKELSLASGEPGKLERRVLRGEKLKLADFPGSGSRRPLRVPLKGLEYSRGRLRFFLPKGSYATLVLREIAKENDVTWSLTSSSSYAGVS